MHSSTAYKVGRTNAGHTMVEVITAIALLGIATMGFMQIHLWGMKATREAQQELAVSRYLYNELEAWRVAAHSGLTPTKNAAPRALCDEATTLEDFRATVDIAPAPSGASSSRPRRRRRSSQSTPSWPRSALSSPRAKAANGSNAISNTPRPAGLFVLPLGPTAPRSSASHAARQASSARCAVAPRRASTSCAHCQPWGTHDEFL